MSVNITSIENAFITWINLILPSVTTIILYQDETRPQKPYITINILGLVRVGQDAQEQPDVSDNQRTVGHREFTLSINSYGSDHNETFQFLDELGTSLQKKEILYTLEADGVSFMRAVGGVNDLTTRLESKYEHRANMDLIFSVQSVENDTVDVIENINMTGEYKDEAGNTTITDVINVT